LKKLFTEGNWEGSGTLNLSFFEEKLPVTCKLSIQRENFDSMEVHIEAKYVVEGYSENLVHSYYFSHFYKKSFHGAFANDTWGTVMGKGFIEDNFVGIEYAKNRQGFTGFESFHLVGDLLVLSAEYAIENQVRSELHVEMNQQQELLCQC